jgi:hypothetical protein
MKRKYDDNLNYIVINIFFFHITLNNYEKDITTK